MVVFYGGLGTVYAQDIQRPEPEVATGLGLRNIARGDDFMIVTANPHATRAGYEILEKGGSAADAAIAAQLVLGLVEPQSSGLGGGSFVLHYDAKEKALQSYDGRETAPFLGGPFLFSKNGKSLGFWEAVLGGRSVGVPGTPALLAELHRKHGALEWGDLFDQATDLAQQGFQISPRLGQMIEAHREKIVRFPQTAAYFLDSEGQPKKAGKLLKNPDYAWTLGRYMHFGPGLFYHGTMAKTITEKVQSVQENPGLLSLEDFESYDVKMRDVPCAPYRAYIVCSMGEPSSGGLTLLQTLGMLERFNLVTWGPKNAKSWHVIAEASRQAFADRAVYMADPDFVQTPGIKLLNPDYVMQRSEIIKTDKTISNVVAGNPPDWEGDLYEKSLGFDVPGTTHISVIDRKGNIVSMTSSVESAFGSHLMVHGFLLNNQLTDFSFSPFDDNHKLVANMVEPGKRPRSSMSPTIVFDENGKPVLVLGSAGGSSIIGYVLQRIIAVLDWGIPLDEAMEMPNILSRGGAIEMEDDRYDIVDDLRTMGHEVTIKEKNSGLTAIYIHEGAYQGVADPRREGVGMGR